MRTMHINKQKFWYALYDSKTAMTDEYGNTGEYQITYADPCEYSANISAAKGETMARQFGESLQYDKIIVMDRNAPAIDEYSVLWIDTVPELDLYGHLVTNEDGSVVTPYDYIVKKVAKSLNSISLAISKVTVSG